MKSPAVLFYTSDFLTGVSSLTMEERGQYITILCLQHQLGHLSKKTIDINVPNCSDDVIKKLTLDENNLYYHHRMEEEINKREEFVESRYINGYKGGRPKKNLVDNHKVMHKGNHIGNDNDNVNIYYNNIELNNIFIEYLTMRKKLKAINSDRAINTLKNKLDQYDDDTKYKMIENSIVNSWKDIYEIKKKKESFDEILDRACKNTEEMIKCQQMK